MREKVYLDTSALYALADGKDANHKRAVEIYKRLMAQKVVLALSDQIISESATLIRRKLGYSASKKFLQIIEEGEGIGLFLIIFTDKELIKKAGEYFLRENDPKLSFVDALSISIMKNEKLKRCFAFDIHFPAAGFVSEK